jgi:predicted O-methyltransferase YrrM
MKTNNIKSIAFKLYNQLTNKKKDNITNVSLEKPEHLIKKLCPELNEKSFNLILDMYSLDAFEGTEQADLINIEKTTRISIEQGSMINKIMKSANVTKSLEIGFAYGFSTMWIMEALMNKPNSHHTAIDPFEKSHWKGVGLKQVEKLNKSANFKWESEYSIHSLSKLIQKKDSFDFIFIDGNHRFDDVLVDFYLSDQLVEPGGIIAFDDMWMPSIKRVAEFILNNRAYEVIEQNVSNMLVLKKVKNDDRKWDHFVDFKLK